MFWELLAPLLTYLGPALAPVQSSPHLLFSTGNSKKIYLKKLLVFSLRGFWATGI
jgi:hypothetical protein